MKRYIAFCLVCLLSTNLWALEYEKTQDNIRVRLLSVVRGRTLLPIKTQNLVAVGTEYITATYIVEYLGKEPVNHAITGGVIYWSKGHQLKIGIPNAARELADVGIHSRYNLKHFMLLLQNYDLSMIKHVERADVYRDTRFGQLPKLNKLDVKIKVGFNEKTCDFVFSDIPLPQCYTTEISTKRSNRPAKAVD
ncbi:MAG: hypothetical protein KAH23_09465 [Kiritimatiellae bacterium]|nr:hypothetical protein [Kiritimatiellia bacterium]